MNMIITLSVHESHLPEINPVPRLSHALTLVSSHPLHLRLCFLIQLAKAGLSRSSEDLGRLAESVDVYSIDDQLFIHSQLDGIAKPTIIPTGDKAKWVSADVLL